MDDNYFRALKEKIELKMNELSRLQRAYIKETGACYIPGGIEARRIKDSEEAGLNHISDINEDLRPYCTAW